MDRDLEYLTIEHAHGQTYNGNGLVVYGHGTYPHGSVMAGRSRRVYLHGADGGSVAEQLAEAKAWAAEHHPGVEVDTAISPSSFVDIDTATAGLEGRDGHPEYGPVDGLDY